MKYILPDEPHNNLAMQHPRKLMRTLDLYPKENHCSILIGIHDINVLAA